jgi:RNA polymerase sigma-70 factor (ECF subfamily)
MKFLKENIEKKLAARLRNGENGAMQELYALYGDYLSALCARYINDDDDLKDVFQDCFVSIMTHIYQFDYRGEGSLRAWVSRIAVNQSLMFLRSKKQKDKTIVDIDIPDEAEVDDPDIHEIPPNVIHEMIRQLPDGYRTVFNLYVFEDKSHKEIAALLNIKEASSASQLHRAKNILAKKINEYKNDKHSRQ